MGLFKRINNTTLLARDIKINENPINGDFYLYVESNEIGFMNWVLKTPGLKDLSVSLSISDKFITRVNGKKHFSIKPTSQIHNFDSGFAKNNALFVSAMSCFLIGLMGFITMVSKSAGSAFGTLIFMAIIGAIFLWLYSKYGAMVIGLSKFNDSGNETLSIRSGMTGKKLDKSDFEQLFIALKNAVSENSQYFKKEFKLTKK